MTSKQFISSLEPNPFNMGEPLDLTSRNIQTSSLGAKAHHQRLRRLVLVPSGRIRTHGALAHGNVLAMFSEKTSA